LEILVVRLMEKKASHSWIGISRSSPHPTIPPTTMKVHRYPTNTNHDGHNNNIVVVFNMRLI
jgi:hypothetical protein